MKRLAEIGQDARLVNFGEYNKTLSGTVLFEKIFSNSMTLSDGFRFNETSVKSIWWRRPQGSVKNTRTSLLQKYIQNESEISLNCSLAFLNGVLWVSEPEATRIANRKPLQLSLARQIGFKMPETCISNDPSEVKMFVERHTGIPLIMKAVGSSYVRLMHDPDDRLRKNKAIYTKIVDATLLMAHICQVSNCPFILQEAVIKDSDIRVTVVDDTVFASEIIIEENSDGLNLDWRHHDVRRKYVMHTLPKDLEDKCVQLVRLLRLKFGCIDLGFSKKDRSSKPRATATPTDHGIRDPQGTLNGRCLFYLE